jgi:hypothetical protein
MHLHEIRETYAVVADLAVGATAQRGTIRKPGRIQELRKAVVEVGLVVLLLGRSRADRRAGEHGHQVGSEQIREHPLLRLRQPRS